MICFGMALVVGVGTGAAAFTRPRATTAAAARLARARATILAAGTLGVGLAKPIAFDGFMDIVGRTVVRVPAGGRFPLRIGANITNPDIFFVDSLFAGRRFLIV